MFRRGQDTAQFRRQLNCALEACRGPQTEILDVLDDLEAVEDVKLLKNSIALAVRHLRAAGAAVLPLEKLALNEPLKEIKQMYQQLRRDLDTGWDAALVQAQKYYSANGTLEMPRKMIVEDNLDLSAWVAAQRQVRIGRRPGYLTQRQIEQLDELKLPWQGLSGRPGSGAARQRSATVQNMATCWCRCAISRRTACAWESGSYTTASAGRLG